MNEQCEWANIRVWADLKVVIGHVRAETRETQVALLDRLVRAEWARLQQASSKQAKWDDDCQRLYGE